jgi:hypothetical protein
VLREFGSIHLCGVFSVAERLGCLVGFVQVSGIAGERRSRLQQ